MSEGDIFERRAEINSESNGDIFERRAKKSQSFGREGEIVGGQLGGAIEANIEKPSILPKAIPVAITQWLEALGPKGGEFIAGLMQHVLGQPSRTEEQKEFLQNQQARPALSEIIQEKVTEGLPENLKQGAQDTADILTLFGPFLKSLAPGKLKGGTKPPISEGPVASPKQKLTPQKMYEERAAFNAEHGLPEGLADEQVIKAADQAAKEIKRKVIGPDISEEIPKSLSQERIRNTTTGGMELEKAVSKVYEDLTAQEKKAYEISKKANKNIEAIHPELVEDLREYIKEFDQIPDKSLPLSRSIKSSRKLLRQLAEIDHSGTVIGYKPISNQILIDQVQEYNKIPTFDFPTDTKTGIFKKLTRQINESIEKTASKHPEAIKSWKEAKKMHSRKSDLFEDPDVYKWTKLADKNYSKEYLSSIDIDKIRKMTSVLDLSPEGKNILQKMKRDLLEKVLKDHFSVSGRFDKKEISRALAELEPVLTPEELKVIEALFEEAKTPGAKAISIVSRFYRYLKRPSQAVKDVGKMT